MKKNSGFKNYITDFGEHLDGTEASRRKKNTSYFILMMNMNDLSSIIQRWISNYNKIELCEEDKNLIMKNISKLTGADINSFDADLLRVLSEAKSKLKFWLQKYDFIDRKSFYDKDRYIGKKIDEKKANELATLIQNTITKMQQVESKNIERQ